MAPLLASIERISHPLRRLFQSDSYEQQQTL
jgi:hypothetical protein